MTLSFETEQGQALLEVHEACKSFGAVRALDQVSLEIRPGEILAVLGDNGAGKSTLIKAISGTHLLDSGDISLDGQPAAIRSPADARKSGIETVYQDLALFDNLDVAENFYAGRESARPTWLGWLSFINRRNMAREAEALLQRLQVDVPDLSTPLGLMSGGQRQAVAVARAVAFASKLVILDEPTAALGVRESRAVLRLVERLPDHGIAVILISHNLAEVTQVAHRAVVLRRGRVVGEAEASAENHELLVSLIVGAERYG